MKTLSHRTCAVAAVLIVSLATAATACAADPRQPELLAFAAASLTDVLGELSAAWTRRSGVAVKPSFAASSVLARQIEAGGAADVFVSADEQWMDYLARRGLVETATRRDLARNRLVLIAPADSALALEIQPGFDLAGALGRDRLATADPDTVPAGRYARAALVSLGAWDAVANRLARADNVRGAMMFVARGEAPLGIVYATDALADRKVRIVGTFPERTHAPITYPGAAVTGARREAAAFLAFIGGPDAAATWKKYGFLEISSER